MKCTSLVLLSVLLAPPLFADAGEHIIPAGALISCTTAEPRLSSKTTAVGDPVLCHLGHTERYGRAVLPYNSYLVGRFEDYRDPGHFVGKGWMELRFDRMVIEPDTIVPIDARVVDVPGYKVDNVGRILGKGHAVRDTVLWTIPILWPIDLLMLPARGPRPTLKEETRMTLKVMDDMAVPNVTEPYTDPYGLKHRSADSYNAPPAQAPQPAPQMSYAPQQPAPQPQRTDYGYNYAPPAYNYSPPPAAPQYVYVQPTYVVPTPVIAMPSIVIAPQPTYGVPGYVYGAPAPPPYEYGYGFGANAQTAWTARAYATPPVSYPGAWRGR